MLTKLVFIEIARDRNFPARVGPGDFRQVQREPRMHMPIQH
jgi:hypothetical protein